MSTLKKTAAGLLALALALGMAACGAGNDTDNVGNSGAANTADSAESMPEKKL